MDNEKGSVIPFHVAEKLCALHIASEKVKMDHKEKTEWNVNGNDKPDSTFQPRDHQRELLKFGSEFLNKQFTKPGMQGGFRRGQFVMIGGATRAERDHAYHAAMTSHIGRFRKNGLVYAFEDINLDAERLKELRLQSEYILQNMRKLTHRAQVVEETTYGSIIKVVRSPVSNSMGKWLLEFLNTPYLYGDPDHKKTATDQGPFIQIQPSGAIHVADKVVGRVDYLGRKMMLNTKHYFGSAHENLTSKVRTLRGSLSGATVDFPDYDHWFKPRPKPPLEAWAEDAVDKMLYQQVYGVDRGYLRAGVLMIPSPAQSLRSMIVQDQKLKARKRLSNPNLMPGRKK